MTQSPLTEIGQLLISLTGQVEGYLQWIINLSIGIAVALLLVRVLIDLFKLNPFGRFAQYARRPTNEAIHQMRSSSLYFPLKKSLGFDPSVLMALIALAILWYVVSGVINNIHFLLRGLGSSLVNFGTGDFFDGGRQLVGVVLLAAIFFLMTLMTITFVNWMFGLLRRASYWSMNRLAPLLRRFEFGGAFAGWSFIILWIALSFAAMAVSAIFLS
ncbi:MAG: hypothetical protein SF339_10475 [Blastocatellia bacterium]|nr:hypothetical protein [Blastocatellia bacterium]